MDPAPSCAMARRSKPALDDPDRAICERRRPRIFQLSGARVTIRAPIARLAPNSSQQARMVGRYWIILVDTERSGTVGPPAQARQALEYSTDHRTEMSGIRRVPRTRDRARQGVRPVFSPRAMYRTLLFYPIESTICSVMRHCT
jgi:hypothetical protein